MSGSIARILGYLLAIGFVATVCVGGFILFSQYRDQMVAPGAQPEMSFRSVSNAVLSALGYPGGGRVLGRMSEGVDPPTIPDRLAAVSARHVVTVGQEVVMTGDGTNSCLGGDSEVLVEIQNDIEADQLDISYAFEKDGETAGSRIIKAASCGKQSQIRQCIPLAPEGRGLRLTALAYYSVEEPVVLDENGMIEVLSKGEVPRQREESRMYPTLIDSAILKDTPKLMLRASDFVTSV